MVESQGEGVRLANKARVRHHGPPLSSRIANNKLERTLRRAEEKAITAVHELNAFKPRGQEREAGIKSRSQTSADILKMTSCFGGAPYVFGVKEEAGEGLWEFLEVIGVGDEVAPVR